MGVRIIEDGFRPEALNSILMTVRKTQGAGIARRSIQATGSISVRSGVSPPNKRRNENCLLDDKHCAVLRFRLLYRDLARVLRALVNP